MASDTRYPMAGARRCADSAHTAVLLSQAELAVRQGSQRRLRSYAASIDPLQEPLTRTLTSPT